MEVIAEKAVSLYNLKPAYHVIVFQFDWFDATTRLKSTIPVLYRVPENKLFLLRSSKHIWLLQADWRLSTSQNHQLVTSVWLQHRRSQRYPHYNSGHCNWLIVNEFIPILKIILKIIIAYRIHKTVATVTSDVYGKVAERYRLPVFVQSWRGNNLTRCASGVEVGH